MTNPIPSFVTKPNLYLEGNYNSFLVLDFETTYDPYDPSAVQTKNEIVLACWTIVDAEGNRTKKYTFGDSMHQQELLNDIAKVDFVVAHNIKFEAGYLRLAGLDLRSVAMYCTQLGEWVLNGNLKVPLNLNATALRYKLGTKTDYVSNMIKMGVCCSTIPQAWLLEYCERDVELCLEIFLKQRTRLATTNRLHIAHTRNLAAIALADIEMNGMYLDKDRVVAEYNFTLRRRNWLKRELTLLTDNINLGSSKQLGEYLYDVLKFEQLKDKRGYLTTDGGSPLTDVNAISKLVAKTEEQKRFILLYKEFNKADSLLTKNLEYFYKTVQQKGGKFHAKFQQGVTATHRLSSTGIPTLFEGESKTKSVQFQNLPRQYKSLFCAGEEGYIIGEADGAQLEFRVGAQVGGDKVAEKEIVEEVDVHSITAQVLTEAGEPTTRQGAKASTFAPLFGGMGKTPAQKAYAIHFKQKYKAIADMQNEWCLMVAAKKYLVLPWGMRFYFPEAQMNQYGRLNVLTNVSNYPIQSLATGEVIPLALIYFWYRTAHTSIQILNTIHDSIVARFKEEDAKIFELLAARSLTTDVYEHLKSCYNYNFVVPLGVGIKISKNWGDTKEEIIYSVTNTGEKTRKVKT